jgi:hypothetical protein
VFAPVARKAALAARAAVALSARPDLRYRDALPLLTAPLRTGGDMAAMLAPAAQGARAVASQATTHDDECDTHVLTFCFFTRPRAGKALSEADVLSAAHFIVGQLRALHTAGVLPAPPSPASPAASGEAQADLPASAACERESDFLVKLHAKAQLLSLRAAHPPRAPSLPPDAHDGGGGGRPHAPPPAPPPVALPPRAAAPPPLPPLTLVPADVAWEVLMLWDMGNTFATLLRLPPFPLHRAAAAFWGAPPEQPLLADAGGDAADMDMDHVAHQAAAALSPGDAAAAATLFSDMCRGLLRVLEGGAGDAASGTTHDAAVCGASAEDVTPAAIEAAIARVAWPARAAAALGSEPASDADDAEGVMGGAGVPSGVLAAALAAATGADADPWAALSPAQRLALATALADAASASEPFREHFNAAYEAAQAAHRLGRVQAYPVRPLALIAAAAPQPLPADDAELLPGAAAPAADAVAAAGPSADAAASSAPLLAPRSWEEAAADRALLRRGQPVGVDELGNRFYELGGPAGANQLFVARAAPEDGTEDDSEHDTAGADAADADSERRTLQSIGRPPCWAVVARGSDAARALAAWLEPRRCAGERAPKAFCERLAQAEEEEEEMEDAEDAAATGAAPAKPRFAPAAPVADGYAGIVCDAAAAAAAAGSSAAVPPLPGGLPGAQRATACLARRTHFWQLNDAQLGQLVSHLRKLDAFDAPSAAGAVAQSASASAAAAVTPGGGGYSMDIVAAQLVDVSALLAASGALGGSERAGAAWPDAARNAWLDSVADSLTAAELADAMATLHAALEAAEVAAAAAVALSGARGAAAAAAPVPLSRAAFVRAAAAHDPTLWLPRVGDEVAILRTGLRATWRTRTAKSWSAPPQGLAPVERARVAAVSYRRKDSGAAYGRYAVAWLLLDRGDASPPFVAPILLAEGASECVQPWSAVAAAAAAPWRRGNAVRVLIIDDADDDTTAAAASAPLASSPGGTPLPARGFYLRGVVVKLRGGDDPWESVRVRIRPDAPGEMHRSTWMSPWELSRDDALTDALDGQLDEEGQALLEQPTSDEDEGEEAGGEDGGAGGAAGSARRLSGGKATLRRGAPPPRRVPLPLDAAADAIADATRALLDDINRAGAAAAAGAAGAGAAAALQPAAGSDMASRMAAMKEFWKRYRAYWAPRGALARHALACMLHTRVHGVDAGCALHRPRAGGVPRVPVFARAELELWPAFQVRTRHACSYVVTPTR